LKDFRLSVSEDEWKQWLKYARRERKRARLASNGNSSDEGLNGVYPPLPQDAPPPDTSAIDIISNNTESSINNFRDSHVYEEKSRIQSMRPRKPSNGASEDFIGVSLSKKMLAQPRISIPPPRKTVSGSMQGSPSRSPNRKLDWNFQEIMKPPQSNSSGNNNHMIAYDLPPPQSQHLYSEMNNSIDNIAFQQSLRPPLLATSPRKSPPHNAAHRSNPNYPSYPTNTSLPNSTSQSNSHMTTTATGGSDRLTTAYSAAKYLIKSFDNLRNNTDDEGLKVER